MICVKLLSVCLNRCLERSMVLSRSRVLGRTLPCDEIRGPLVVLLWLCVNDIEFVKQV